MCQNEKPMYSINLCYCSLRNTLESTRRRKPLTKCIRLTMGEKAMHISLCKMQIFSSVCSTVPHLRVYFHFVFFLSLLLMLPLMLLLLLLHFHRSAHTYTINCYRSTIIQLLFKWSEHFHFYYSF